MYANWEGMPGTHYNFLRGLAVETIHEKNGCHRRSGFILFFLLPLFIFWSGAGVVGATTPLSLREVIPKHSKSRVISR